jgi:maleate isomerase
MADRHCGPFPSSFAPEAAAARIALINMCTDERGEAAFRSLMPAGTQIYTARVGVDLQAYNEGRFELLGGFPFLAGALPPPERIDLIAFSCTSGTIAGGEGFVAAGFAPTHPGIPCTNPATAAAVGLRAAGARTIALLTPYPPKVHAKFPPYFAERGITVVADGSFDLQDDALVGRVDYASFLSAGRALLADCKPDALFISCAAFDVVDKLASLGKELGVPVYSSSQLFAWHARQLLKIDPLEFLPASLMPQALAASVR